MRTEAGQVMAHSIQSRVLPLFTPLGRAVNLDVSLIPGGWKLKGADAAQEAAVMALFSMSRWAVEGDLFTKFACAMGEAGLYVQDDRTNGTVRLRPIRPDAYVRMADGVIMLSKEGKEELATVVQADLVREYKGGKLVSQYQNTQGQVPFVEAILDGGDGYGEPTFDDAIVALEQVNQQATYMAKMIERHAEPQWAVFGTEPTELEKNGESVWFFPDGSSVQAILAAVDFDGLLKFINEIKAEMKDALPELALRELVGVTRVAAATIELQMAEAVYKIRRLRHPIDLALSEAVLLAGVAGVRMGLAELAPLAAGRIYFDAERPVIAADTLTRLQIEQAELGNTLARGQVQGQALLMGDGMGGNNGG